MRKASLVLILFALTLALAVSIAQAQAPAGEEYVVQADDWLSKIADKYYGNVLAYPAIVDATNAKAAEDSSFAVIDNPDLIEVGQKLWIPGEVDLASLPPAPVASFETALRNTTYSGIYDNPITLTDGSYTEDFFMVTYLSDSELYGDLDGDGVDDAVVFLNESGGGSGTFMYVAAQLNKDGQPVDAGAVWLEDRIQIKSAAIENGQINLEITTVGPGDAACCKTHFTRKSFALQDGVLAEIPNPEAPVQRASAADLNGTTWTLVQLDDNQPVPADPPITISFTDSQVSGSAGCNTYNGDFSLADDNPFIMTLGPLATTRMICPDEIQQREDAYLAALQNVSLWGYDFGNLGITYNNEAAEFGRSNLLFVPASEEVATQLPEMPAETDMGERTRSVAELTANTWQWVSLTDPLQQVEIANPENYTLTFNADGSLNVVADCNQANATFTADDSGSLSITPGPTTLALCPDDGQGERFVQNLGFVSNFFLEGGYLYMDMMADGGTFKLAPAASTP